MSVIFVVGFLAGAATGAAAAMQLERKKKIQRKLAKAQLAEANAEDYAFGGAAVEVKKTNQHALVAIGIVMPVVFAAALFFVKDGKRRQSILDAKNLVMETLSLGVHLNTLKHYVHLMTGDEGPEFKPITFGVPSRDAQGVLHDPLPQLGVQSVARAAQPIGIVSPDQVLMTKAKVMTPEAFKACQAKPVNGMTMMEVADMVEMGTARMGVPEKRRKMKEFKRMMCEGRFLHETDRCLACGNAFTQAHEYTVTHYPGCSCGENLEGVLTFQHDTDCRMKGDMEIYEKLNKSKGNRFDYPTWSCFTVYACESQSRFDVLETYCLDLSCDWSFCQGDGVACMKQVAAQQIWRAVDERTENLCVGASVFVPHRQTPNVEVPFHYGDTEEPLVSIQVVEEDDKPVLKEINQDTYLAFCRTVDDNVKCGNLTEAKGMSLKQNAFPGGSIATDSGLGTVAEDFSWRDDSGFAGLGTILSHLNYMMARQLDGKNCIRYSIDVKGGNNTSRFNFANLVPQSYKLAIRTLILHETPSGSFNREILWRTYEMQGKLTYEQEKLVAEVKPTNGKTRRARQVSLLRQFMAQDLVNLFNDDKDLDRVTPWTLIELSPAELEEMKRVPCDMRVAPKWTSEEENFCRKWIQVHMVDRSKVTSAELWRSMQFVGDVQPIDVLQQLKVSEWKTISDAITSIQDKLNVVDLQKRKWKVQIAVSEDTLRPDDTVGAYGFDHGRCCAHDYRESCSRVDQPEIRCRECPIAHFGSCEGPDDTYSDAEDFGTGFDDETTEEFFDKAEMRFNNEPSMRKFIVSFVKQYCVSTMLMLPLWLIIASRGAVLKQPIRVKSVVPRVLRRGITRKVVQFSDATTKEMEEQFDSKEWCEKQELDALIHQVGLEFRKIKVDGWSPVTWRKESLEVITESGFSNIRELQLKYEVEYDEMAVQTGNCRVIHNTLSRYFTTSLDQDCAFWDPHTKVTYTLRCTEQVMRHVLIKYLTRMPRIVMGEVNQMEFVTMDMAATKRGELVAKVKNFLMERKKPIACFLLVASLFAVGCCVWYYYKNRAIEVDDFAKGKQKNKVGGGKQRKQRYWIDYEKEERWQNEMSKNFKNFRAERFESEFDEETGFEKKNSKWRGTFTNESGETVNFVYDSNEKGDLSGWGALKPKVAKMKYNIPFKGEEIAERYEGLRFFKHERYEDYAQELANVSEQIEAIAQNVDAQAFDQLRQAARKLNVLECKLHVRDSNNLMNENLDANKIDNVRRRIYSLHPTEKQAKENVDSLGNAISTLGGLLIPAHMNLTGMGKLHARGFNQRGEPQIVPVDVAKAAEHPASQVPWKPRKSERDIPDGWAHRFIPSHEVSTKKIQFMDPIIGEKVVLVDPANHGTKLLNGVVQKTEQVKTPNGAGLSYKILLDDESESISNGSCNGVAMSVERNAIVGYIHAGRTGENIAFVQPAGWMSSFNQYY